MKNIAKRGSNSRKNRVDRRSFLASSGLAAAALASAVPAGAVETVRASPARKGLGEKYSLIVCPWTAENPRHDHQQIFPLSDGRLMLVWSEYYVHRPSRIFRSTYSQQGSRDDTPCRISARISKDSGRSWSGRIILQDNVWGRNVKHPNLARTPSGDVVFLFTSWEHDIHERRIMLRRSSDDCETWSEPEQMSPPGGFYPINADHILVHSSGRIVLPVFWSPKIWEKGEHFRAFCFYSDDDGRTWQQSRNRIDLPKRGAEEPAIAEAPDGSLVCMLRTTLGKIYQAFSQDRGESWSEAQPTKLPSPSAASALKRVPGTSDLLFLWNNATPYALSRPGSTSFHYPRNPLSSALSKDGGRTWTNIRVIENREGYISGYPAVTFVGDEALVTYYHASESGSRDSDVRLKIFDKTWLYAGGPA